MTKARVTLSVFSVVASIAAGPSACRTWVAEPPTPDRITAAGEKGPVRVVKTDNSVVTLTHPSVVGDSLFGIGTDVASAHIAIPITQVKSIETREASAGRSAGLGAGIIIGLLAVAGLVVGIALLGSHGQY